MPIPIAMTRLAKRQFQRGRQSLQEILQHGSAGGSAGTQVAPENAGQIASILNMGRLVQAHGDLHLVDHFLRRERPKPDDGRIARQHIGQRERNQRDPQEGRNDEQQPTQKITSEHDGTPTRDRARRPAYAAVRALRSLLIGLLLRCLRFAREHEARQVRNAWNARRHVPQCRYQPASRIMLRVSVVSMTGAKMLNRSSL